MSKLSKPVIRLLGDVTNAQWALLRVVPASEARAGNSPNAIAGYPATTALRSVSTSDVSKLINALVRDASYDFDIRQRCVNKGFIGVRFLTTPSVDFALGTPCNQAIWEFSGTEKTQRWGAVLTNSAAAIVRSVLEGPAR